MKYNFLISKLKSLVASERKITAEIVELIREIDHKRIYLAYGHTSMFSFLTKDCGYSPSAAMRRIDAARLSREIPEINESLKCGEINLSQVSMLSQAIRQKQKEQWSKSQVSKETKVFLLEKLKSLDLVATQKTLASHLDLEAKTHEKKTYQKDESLRMEITLSKRLQQDLERVKELISHQNPNPSMAELIQFLANHFLNNKDPLRTKVRTKKEVVKNDSCKESAYAGAVPASRQRNSFISAKSRREIFQRDQCCQWITQKKNNQGKIEQIQCGSTFQLQIDHIEPLWQDGASNPENLQVLCAVHNKLKYQYEVVGRKN